MAANSNAHEIQKLYIEYFGRPADPASLAYWVGVLGQNAATGLAAAKTAFGASAEFTSAFVGLSSMEAVDKMYVALFGRHSEGAGLIFWANNLDRGTVTLGDIVNALGSGAQAY